ncbi:MAG: hypothetical protein HY865_20585 [Chloroflexi bacterium]|nr:hypothetical protein [Chloroflexota bacterium]
MTSLSNPIKTVKEESMVDLPTCFFLALAAILTLFQAYYAFESAGYAKLPVDKSAAIASAGAGGIAKKSSEAHPLHGAKAAVSADRSTAPLPDASMAVYIDATVWETDPVAPILLYHKFKTNGPSTLTMVSRLDFAEDLEKLYQNGYVTISLERWLAGDIRVPEGKRPLVLSMDDLFFRNQITLTPEGEPAADTGIGVAWEFYKNNPDFGFHWALFSNLGDKPYGTGSQEEQQIELARTIVWCIEHDAKVYNHTFRHVDLKNTKGLGITAELWENDKHLRRLLTLVDRPDLIPGLQNMVALPGGKWPRVGDAQTALYGYTDPEGKKVQAIFNVDYISRPDFLAAPYARSFDPVNLPRMVANLKAVDYLVENKETVPAASSCKIGPLTDVQSNDPDFLDEQILAMIQNGQCPQGVYATEHFIFSANDERVELIQKVEESFQP